MQKFGKLGNRGQAKKTPCHWWRLPRRVNFALRSNPPHIDRLGRLGETGALARLAHLARGERFGSLIAMRRWILSFSLNTSPARVRREGCSSGWVCLPRPPCRGQPDRRECSREAIARPGGAWG